VRLNPHTSKYEVRTMQIHITPPVRRISLNVYLSFTYVSHHHRQTALPGRPPPHSPHLLHLRHPPRSLHLHVSALRAGQFGFDLPAHADCDFKYVFGGRNIAIGLMMYAFWFKRQYKAMGMCCCVSVLSRLWIRSLRGRVRERPEWGPGHAVGDVVRGTGLIGWRP
jgi:hypothetical protein